MLTATGRRSARATATTPTERMPPFCPRSVMVRTTTAADWLTPTRSARSTVMPTECSLATTAMTATTRSSRGRWRSATRASTTTATRRRMRRSTWMAMQSARAVPTGLPTRPTTTATTPMHRSIRVRQSSATAWTTTATTPCWGAASAHPVPSQPRWRRGTAPPATSLIWSP